MDKAHYDYYHLFPILVKLTLQIELILLKIAYTTI